MEKDKGKKVQTFASIFGDDYDPNESKKDDGISTLKLNQLVPFEKHPFKLYEGDRLDEMVESIKNFGVIVPIVVRKKGLEFEILSGHNRVNAAKMAGHEEIPAVIKEGLSQEEATLIVTETNLMQRSFSDLLHSERATVIATRHDAMKKQGVRTDLLNEIEMLSKAREINENSTSCPVGTKLDSKKEVGDEYGLSPRNVSRYLRIDKLNGPLKELVDSEKIAIRAGVNLSYLSNEKQEMIEAIVSENTFKVDIKKSELIKSYDHDGKLTWDNAKAIITGQAMRKNAKSESVRVQPKIISKYFAQTENKKEIEKVIDKALSYYFCHLKEQANSSEKSQSFSDRQTQEMDEEEEVLE